MKNRIFLVVLAMLMMALAAPTQAQDDETPRSTAGGSIVFSPDGEYIAYSCAANGASVCIEFLEGFGAINYVPRVSRYSLANPVWIVFSPDGEYIAYSCAANGASVCIEFLEGFGAINYVPRVSRYNYQTPQD